MAGNLNIRVPDGYLEELDIKAQIFGMNRTDFVMNALDMILNFDEVFYKKIIRYSQGLNTPEWLVMQNIIIRRMAHDHAKAIVWGASGETLKEFVSVDDGDGYKTITGEPLFDMLNKMFIEDEEKEKVKVLLNDELYGVPIGEDDKKLLIKYRTGRTWLESEEYQKEQERKAEIKQLSEDFKLKAGAQKEV